MVRELVELESLQRLVALVLGWASATKCWHVVID